MAQLIFFLQGFFHRHWRFTGQQREGMGVPSFYHSTTSTSSWTLKYLFATLHMRWLSPTFNCNACVYQTATRQDLPPYQISIWLIDWWGNAFLFTWLIYSRFLLQRFDKGNRRIWTRINYHPCITSEPSDQVC